MAGKVNKFVVFIPVRGGSKSIPKKNIKLMAGKPLIYWALSAAEECDLIDAIYVSTDDEEIASVVAQFGGEKTNIFRRSPETATDTASTESAMLEFANTCIFENIILIQATSPMITSQDLEKAIQLYLQSKADSLLSVVRQKRFTWQVQESDQGIIKVAPQNYDVFNRPRRQEFDGMLVENGAFYITSRNSLLETENRLSGEIVGYEMDESSYFEIDEPADWLIVEKLLENRKKGNHSLQDKCKAIKMLIMDCDGVLTDAGMYYTHEGHELKKFNTRDGMGLELIRQKGIKTAIITGENSPIVEHRARKLKIDEVVLGCKDKLLALQQIIKKHGLKLNQVAYIGDDINDLPVIQQVGLGVAVANAVKIVHDNADYVTISCGGEGAVREVSELIIDNLI